MAEMEVEEALEQPAKIEVGPEQGVIGEANYSETMGHNFLVYAVSTLTDRALPSIDGLKPVQRRILLAMNDLRLRPGSSYAKCAKIVGQTLGSYHPHGDASVYGALVNMVQDFTLRVPLIDGQGSFGSVDGDAAAAPRYTEARLAGPAMELLQDLHKEILPDHFGKNYDGSEDEPILLPARVPNLLINGAVGIAVGMSTGIMPHNPAEVIDLCTWRLKHPEAGVEEVAKRIDGPDFPTGGMVVDNEGLRSSYLTGKGKVTALAKAHVEPIEGNREKIVVTEIPWSVHKGDLLVKIAKKIQDGIFPEVVYFNDFSSGDHDIRVELHLKRGANARGVLQRLLKHTDLRKTYGVEMNVLIDGRPKTLNLAEIIDHFLSFRREVVVNRAKKRIAEIEARLHKLEAYVKVVDATDKVVQTIKRAKDRNAAKPPLKKLLKVDDQQAQWIVEMQLGQLTQLDRSKLLAEVKELKAELKELKKLIKTEKLITQLMSEEFEAVKSAWKQEGRLERQTGKVSAAEGEEISSMTVSAEDCIALISRRGRAVCGTGTLRRGASLKLDADDRLICADEARTDEERIVFSSAGKAYRLRLAEISLEHKRSRGDELSSLIGIGGDEEVAAAIPITDAEKRAGEAALFVSRLGHVKRTSWAEFDAVHGSGVVAAKVAAGDELLKVIDCPDDADVLLVASSGKCIRFAASELRIMGRSAAGVRGMRLKDGESVVDAIVISKGDQKGQLMLATDAGFAKRTPFSELPVQGRGGGGVVLMKAGGKYGQPRFIASVTDKQTIFVEVGAGKLKPYPISRVAKTKTRAIVPKRWPSGEHALGVIAVDD